MVTRDPETICRHFNLKCPTEVGLIVAPDEARKISQRTKAALEAAKRRGVRLGKPENLTDAARAEGASTNRNNAVTAYALTTPLIERLRATGLSMNAIADKLNEGGHKTRTGSIWTAMQVKRILDRSSVGTK